LFVVVVFVAGLVDLPNNVWFAALGRLGWWWLSLFVLCCSTCAGVAGLELVCYYASLLGLQILPTGNTTSAAVWTCGIFQARLLVAQPCLFPLLHCFVWAWWGLSFFIINVAGLVDFAQQH
jgi:hypothetical protein